MKPITEFKGTETKGNSCSFKKQRHVHIPHVMYESLQYYSMNLL
jgi:hypothetical protein